jgi:hypothetical protein
MDFPRYSWLLRPDQLKMGFYICPPLRFLNR